MTWQHYVRALGIMMTGALALALASHARAEGNVIPPDQAAALVRAQLEEQKAAADALKEEAAAEAAESTKAGRASKSAEKKGVKEAAAPISAKAKSNTIAKDEADSATLEHDAGSKAASIGVESSVRSSSELVESIKTGALKPLITQYASENGLPYELADAVVRLESRYNSGARRGLNVGLTQINIRTAQSLGYRGDAAGLLDAETNLRYGLKYLAVAFKLAGGDTCGAILRYQFGLRTTSTNKASRAYCAKVKVLTAAAD